MTNILHSFGLGIIVFLISFFSILIIGHEKESTIESFNAGMKVAGIISFAIALAAFFLNL